MYLAGAIIAPLVLILSSSNANDSFATAAVLSGIFLVIAGYHWFKFTKTPEEAVLYDITKEPPAEQIRLSKRLIWILVILGPLLSYWTYKDLTSVETGEAGSAIVWAPVAIFYDNFGFWPAVLFWPFLSLVIVGASFFRIVKAKSIIASEND